MPLYQYHCDKCEAEFSQMEKIVNRNDPVEKECPECGVSGSIRMGLNAPMLCYSIDRSLKVSDTFNDRLIEIKKTKGRGNTIQTRRSPI